MGNRLFAVLFAVVLFVASVAVCLFYTQTHNEGRFDYVSMIARDKDLLTAEQQRELVRNGQVTVTLAGREYTFYNNQEMKPYLNEGGAR